MVNIGILSPPSCLVASIGDSDFTIALSQPNSSSELDFSILGQGQDQMRKYVFNMKMTQR